MIAVGRVPDGKSVGAPKVPLPLPRSTETFPELLFATTRSVCVSASTSPAASANGPSPAVDSPKSVKLPVPSPSMTSTPPSSGGKSEPFSAVARSRWPSPLKSLVTTASGVSLPDSAKSVALKLSCANADGAAASQSVAAAPASARVVRRWVMTGLPSLRRDYR